MVADMACFAAAYNDDIVIYSTNFEEHLNHLEAITDNSRHAWLWNQYNVILLNQPASILDTWLEQEM